MKLPEGAKGFLRVKGEKKVPPKDGEREISFTLRERSAPRRNDLLALSLDEQL